MPAYEEKLPTKWKSLLLLLFTFATIYFPLQLGDWELRWREDRYAAMAAEMNLSHPNTIAHGEQIPFSSPVFPWLTAVMHRTTDLSLEFCMRLLSVASVAILAILAWEAGRRANDLQTAIVAAAMVLSSAIVMEKATDGYPHFTGLMFLFAAWLTWFTFGVARGQWNRAWIFSFFLASMAFYTVGWVAILVFIFPLIFMRRPMTVWPKLTKPGFFAGLAMLIFFILIWVLPRWMAEGQTPFRDFSISIDRPEKYIKHLIFFPFAIASRYLPWTFIAWPAFCVAYFPLDKNPIFSRFLRTIVISLFFLLWISPATDARDFIYIGPPLAVLCGINYWLLVRRHGHQLGTLFRFFLYLCAALSAGIIIFYLLPTSVLVRIPYLKGNIAFHDINRQRGVIQSALALLVALLAIRSHEKRPLYSHIIMISVSVGLCIWAVHIPYRQLHSEKRRLGTAFANAIKEDMHLSPSENLPDSLTVFKGPGIIGFYAPCIYMNTKVKKVHKISEIPEDLDPVYMIVIKYPKSTERKWDYIPDGKKPFVYGDENFYIIKGTKIKKESKTE